MTSTTIKVQPYSSFKHSFQQKETVIANFEIDTNYTYCGLPFCYQGTQPHFTLENIIPDNLISIKPELSQFMKDFNEINYNYAMPKCPWEILATFCPPIPCINPFLITTCYLEG